MLHTYIILILICILILIINCYFYSVVHNQPGHTGRPRDLPLRGGQQRPAAGRQRRDGAGLVLSRVPSGPGQLRSGAQPHV